MVLVALVDRDYGVEIFNRELGEKVFITLSTLAEYITKHQKTDRRPAEDRGDCPPRPLRIVRSGFTQSLRRWTNDE